VCFAAGSAVAGCCDTSERDVDLFRSSEREVACVTNVADEGLDQGELGGVPSEEGGPMTLMTGAKCQGGAFAADVADPNFVEIETRLGAGETQLISLGTRVTVLEGIAYCSVKQFGATGNGVTDDTDNIQTAINYAIAMNQPLYFPKGTYIVSPRGASPRACFRLTAGIPIFGDGMGVSTIKVANSAGEYLTIFTSTNSLTDVSNFYIHDLTFDHNIANNQFDGTYAAGTHCNASVIMYAGAKLRYERLEIKNASPVWSLVFGLSVTSGMIRDCTFSNIGDDPSHQAHDSSLIYTHAITGSVSILNNVMVSAGWNKPAACTAIETHNSKTIVRGNQITDFAHGMYITGVDTIDDHSIIVQGNTINGALDGIDLWCEPYLTHTDWRFTGGVPSGAFTVGENVSQAGSGAVVKFVTMSGTDLCCSYVSGAPNGTGVLTGAASGETYTPTDAIRGYGLYGVVVQGNTIRLCGYLPGAAGYWANATPEGGIYINPSAGGEMDVCGIIIADNYIYHPLETGAVTNNTASLAIGWRSFLAKGIYHSQISNNIIENFPLTAVRFTCGISDVKVFGNQFVNCASSLDVGASASYKYPIFIAPPAGSIGINDLIIEHNTFDDNIASTRFVSCYYLDNGTVTTSNFVIRHNNYHITGAKPGGFRYVYTAGANAIPYINEEIEGVEAYMVGTQAVVIGSTVHEPTTDITFRATTGTVWNKTTYGTAAPGAGAWLRGDVVWNTAPAGSGWIGWVCTASASPGTWKGFGAIDA
jgi:putative cofactor-binding repeat protein